MNLKNVDNYETVRMLVKIAEEANRAGKESILEIDRAIITCRCTATEIRAMRCDVLDSDAYGMDYKKLKVYLMLWNTFSSKMSQT